jgi:hypothetical protein
LDKARSLREISLAKDANETMQKIPRENKYGVFGKNIPNSYQKMKGRKIVLRLFLRGKLRVIASSKKG